MHRSGPSGFTLVELLVVITIIAVLMTLLMPAMEQAVYQARLAQCSGSQKLTASAATVYAMDFKNWYPYNPSHDPGVRRNWLSHMVRVYSPSSQPDDGLPAIPGITPPSSGQGWPEYEFDLRPLLSPYLAINKALNDPLTQPPVDLEKSDANLVYGSYGLRFGWAWFRDAGGKLSTEDGAFRMNQKFTWSHNWEDPNQSVRYRFSVIVSDHDRVNTGYYSPHPDKAGRTYLWWRQDQPGGSSGQTTTAAHWIPRINSDERGLVDTNVTYQDMSVHRFDDVTTRDERMVRVPTYNNGASGPANLMDQIPKE